MHSRMKSATMFVIKNYMKRNPLLLPITYGLAALGLMGLLFIVVHTSLMLLANPLAQYFCSTTKHPIQASQQIFPIESTESLPTPLYLHVDNWGDPTVSFSSTGFGLFPSYDFRSCTAGMSDVQLSLRTTADDDSSTITTIKVELGNTVPTLGSSPHHFEAVVASLADRLEVKESGDTITLSPAEFDMNEPDYVWPLITEFDGKQNIDSVLKLRSSDGGDTWMLNLVETDSTSLAK